MTTLISYISTNKKDNYSLNDYRLNIGIFPAVFLGELALYFTPAYVTSGELWMHSSLSISREMRYVSTFLPR